MPPCRNAAAPSLYIEASDINFTAFANRGMWRARVVVLQLCSTMSSMALKKSRSRPGSKNRVWIAAIFVCALIVAVYVFPFARFVSRLYVAAVPSPVLLSSPDNPHSTLSIQLGWLWTCTLTPRSLMATSPQRK